MPKSVGVLPQKLYFDTSLKYSSISKSIAQFAKYSSISENIASKFPIKDKEFPDTVFCGKIPSVPLLQIFSNILGFMLLYAEYLLII